MPHHAPSLYNKNAAAFEANMPLFVITVVADRKPPLVFVIADRLKTAGGKTDRGLGRGCHAFC
jgi:hypothetical protein